MYIRTHLLRGVDCMSRSFKRANYERMKRKEYSKSYLAEKEGRYEEANNYPKTRRILLRDFFKTPDLYKAIGFFMAIQISIILITSSVTYPHIAGALNLVGMLVGGISVLLACREINKRQRGDNSRRKLKWSITIKSISIIIGGLVLSSIVYQFLDIQNVVQPNQSSIDSLMSLYPVAMIFTIVIVSPIIEELVFRELLPHATGPSYLSFGITSILFIALHAPAGIIGWSSYGVLSIGFLYARLKNNNVYASIRVHMIWNLITVII